jgi:hypothetical protein
MINFFRKIRKQLADDNKPLKYARYAIGEIVLVVIGILIALSINNWNESQKIEDLEINMLVEVKDGLEFDLKEIEKITVLHNGFIVSQQITIDWLQNSLPFQDTIGHHFTRTFYSESFIFKEGPYETLKQIGLEIIKNDTIRDQISNLYDLKYEEVRLWNEDFFTFKQHYRDQMGENRFKMINHSDIFAGFEPLNVSNLKADESFLFKLSMMMNGVKLYNARLEDLKIDINQLINLIELELRNR